MNKGLGIQNKYNVLLFINIFIHLFHMHFLYSVILFWMCDFAYVIVIRLVISIYTLNSNL